MSGILQTFYQVFGAGQVIAWNVRAANFRLLDGDAVDVSFFLNGAIVGVAKQVDSGFYLKSDAVFDKVEISSAAAQTVKFTAGSAEAGAASAVSISGDVSTVGKNAAFVHSGPAVIPVSSQVLAANPARRFLLIQNNDASATVFLNLSGGVASLNNGLKLSPGASAVFDVVVPTGGIVAISDGVIAGGLLAIIEA